MKKKVKSLRNWKNPSLKDDSKAANKTAEKVLVCNLGPKGSPEPAF